MILKNIRGSLPTLPQQIMDAGLYNNTNDNGNSNNYDKIDKKWYDNDKRIINFFSVIERQRFRLASYQTKFPDIHICHTKSNNYNDAVKIINNCDYDCNNDGNSHNNL